MNFDNRVWRTGLIAVIAAGVFGILVFRLAERTRTTGEFGLYGQTALPTAAITKILPQIAVGSFDGGLTKYTTIIQITNPGATTVTVSGNFYKEEPNAAAGTSFPFSFATNRTSPSTITGSFSSVAVAPNASLILTGASSNEGNVGWCRITSTGSISVATVFELRDGATDVLYSRAGVAASAGDMKTFIIPRLRNYATGLDVAFALVNTGATSAAITATLYNSSGDQVGSPQTLTVAGLGHTTKFAAQLFNLLSGEANGSSYIRFSSSSGQWAAMALAFEGAISTSFPVERLE
jgi:hypothetical protein